mgnify:CR=1 FL=1
MIIIINGPLGIGKTSVSWELLRCFERAAMLDGDYLGAIQPFEIYDEARIAYLDQTFVHMSAWHKQHGYTNLVINYVFEQPEALARLRGEPREQRGRREGAVGVGVVDPERGNREQLEQRLEHEVDGEESEEARRDAGRRLAGDGQCGHADSSSMRPSRARPISMRSPSPANTASSVPVMNAWAPRSSR